LEVQVALAIFAVGLGGLIPLTVINTRQVRALTDRLPADEVHYLVPPENSWAAKLGTPATISPDPPPAESPIVQLVDDGDAGYAEQDLASPDWTSVVTPSAFGDGFRQNDGGSEGDTAAWSFADLPPCGYEVFVTYPESASGASDAPFHVYDDAAALGVVRVDQRSVPAGPVYEGVHWDSLGIYAIQSGVLIVELTDDADGDIAADAVRVVPVRNELEILNINASPDESAVSVQVSVTVP
jgi:hypothetical protein